MAEPWEPVPVQSDEGQNRVRASHERRMRALDAYPTIRTHVYDDAWAEGHLHAALALVPGHKFLGHPWPYVAPGYIGLCLPDDYLERVEKGLVFLIAKSRKENRNDLIGRLRDGAMASLTAIFEVMLAYALVSHFGEDGVEAYPRIAHDSRKTVEFAVHSGATTILVEATAHFDPKQMAEAKAYCLAKGLPFFRWVDYEAEIGRFIRACADKASQREVEHPLVLCLNQLTEMDPDDGRRALEHVLQSMDAPDESMLVAVAYFTHGHFQGFHVFESQVEKLKADRDVLDEIRKAMERLPRQPGDTDDR